MRPLHKFLRACALSLTGIAGSLLAGPVSVSELNYNPAGDGDEEFIELINTSATAYALDGCSFTTGITYTFASLTLQPGARVVVCRDRTKFTARYGTIANLAPGAYTGRLSDDGEAVVLTALNGTELFRFSYSPSGDWPSRANGLGSSLECLNPDGNLSSAANWRSSTEYHGNPGRAGIGPIRSVVVNEVLAHTDPPLEDAIELHNTTSQPIDIGGWFLSSRRSKPTRFRIPSPWVIPANGYTVFYQYQFDSISPAPGDDPFALSSSEGDEAVLMSADSNGNPQYWMDAVSFGPTQNGVSLGRYPNGSGPLVPMSALSLGSSIVAGESPDRISSFRTGAGAANPYPLVGPIVFNRIMYRPAPGGDEFVELLNSATYPIALYDPLYPMNRWRISSGIEYTFDSAILLEPGEKILIVPTTASAFRLKYSLPESLKVVGPYTNQLSNSGERIALLRPDPPQQPPAANAGLVPYILVEDVTYSPSAPWPTAADGTGAALLRRNPTLFADDPASWTVDTLAPVPNLAASWNGSTLNLQWAPVSDQQLVLESAAASNSSNWSQVALINAGTASHPVSASDDARFFRLRRP
jgi:hypothetical protein